MKTIVKKAVSYGVFLLVILAYSQAWSATNKGPYFIDALYGNDNFLGTAAQPFQTIQKAINRIAPGVLVTSATCYIASVTSSESVLITSNNTGGPIVLKGDRANPPVLKNGTGTYILKIRKAGNIIISGLKFMSSESGIELTNNGANVEIRNCQFVSNTSQGILCKNTLTAPLVIANQFRNNSVAGISSQPLVRGFTARSNIFTKHSTAIAMRGMNVSAILDNHISRNSGNGILLITGARSNLIARNTIISNNYAGIHCYSNQVARNVIRSNAFGPQNYRSIILNDADVNEIRANSFTKSLVVDIAIYGNCKSNVILKNVFTNSAAVLSAYSDSGVPGGTIVTNLMIISNTLRNMSGGGFSLQNCHQPVVAGNYISHVNSAVFTEYTTLASISNNTFTSNQKGSVLASDPLAFTRKNIFNNSIQLYYSLSKNLAYSNNYWGPLSAAQVRASLHNIGVTNRTIFFLPMRLSGPFQNGVNSIPPPRVTVTKATQISRHNASISWTSSVGAVRYNLYRSSDPSVSNISRSSGLILSTANTSYTDTVPGDGNWYYSVTALDNGGGTIFTNESWFSLSRRAFVGPLIPSPVSNLAGVVTGSDSVSLKWKKKGSEEDYKVFMNSQSSMTTGGSLTSLAVLPSNQTNPILHTGFTNRTLYFWVKSTNIAGTGGFGSMLTLTTFAAPPKVSCTSPLNTIQTNPYFIFTDNQGNNKTGYHYAWSQNPSTPVSADWNMGMALNTSKTLEATGDGEWYLNVVSYNMMGVGFHAELYGPYRHYDEYVGPFQIGINKKRIEPDGLDTAIISNVGFLTNFYTAGVPLSDGALFYIEKISGQFDLKGTVFSNGKSFIRSSAGKIRFRISGRDVSTAIIRVVWAGESTCKDEVDFMISPPMDLGAVDDAVIYYNVVNPDQNEKLDIIFNANEGEQVRFRFYDILRRKLVYEMQETGGQLGHAEYDLRTVQGHTLPDGIYGVVITGQTWRKELKFIVKRR